jgi:biopolymer transport protein ExbD
MKRRRRPPGAIQAEINVTPLVDVVLVLLIIFMVVTPMITEGPPLELPRTSHHDRKRDSKDLVVSVTRDGRLFLDTNPTSLPNLPRLIEEARRLSPGRLVYVKGDTSVPYGTVREVMEAVHQAHLDDLMLATDEQH